MRGRQPRREETPAPRRGSSLPHLRFARDRRGYETTSLVHTPRRRGRGQPRILYWFRTPPGVRVGRAAIDEDAIRLLEQHNPDVQFDWTRILKQPFTTESQRPQPQPQQRHGAKPSRSVNVSASQPQRERDEQPAEHLIDTSPVDTPGSTAAIDIDPPPMDEAEAERVTGDDPLGVDREAERQQEPGSETDEEEEPRLPAVFTRIGAEGLARLRARYAEVMARISDRQMEEEAREELKGRAERLNPDAWVTDDEVRQGLEQYETVFESLRSLVGHPRRRRRRRS